ncbi:MAG TPA: glycosyltransferase family 2 protein [Vicinamibacterales bacterium]|nr:glycosyltransferase family 2 protein [Vicinamibacterales bacterium]
MRVRWMAARVILWQWMSDPPGPSDLARTIRRRWRTLVQSGPRGLLRDFNAGTHALAREGGKLVYGRWIKSFDRLSDRDIAAIQKAATELDYRPLLSVVMPVYDPDERWLRAAIESVQNQLYPRWELCIADDHSSNGLIRELLREIEAGDARIKVVFRQVNGHISAASNSALALASGEFVVLLDHDDVLPRHALLAVVCELNRHPDADLLYSDEDKIDEQGRRFDPYFKSDWNPELFYGQNMISHLGVYRREIVERVGGFREGFEGSQDYDLALRVVEHTRPDRIRHIPHILYHWRAVPGSAALAPDEKAYARDAARRAVQEHFDRIGLQAVCEPAPRAPSHHRIRYRVPEVAPHVTIIIPTRDRVDLLSRCIDSIRSRSTYAAHDIVIVDNGSSTPEFRIYSDRARRDSRISILRIDEPFNFSRLNNLGAARARGALLCFLNNDTEVISPDWLEELVSLASREEIGAVGATLYHPDDTVQHAGIALGLGGIAAHRFRGLPRGEAGNSGLLALTQAVSAVSAACMMVRKKVFDEVGGFDEALAVAYNDVDLCLRLGRRGLRNVWTPFAELYHFESATRGTDVRGEARARLLAEAQVVRQRWRDVLGADPYFNPNLSLERPDFALAYPPRHTASWWQVRSAARDTLDEPRTSVR